MPLRNVRSMFRIGVCRQTPIRAGACAPCLAFSRHTARAEASGHSALRRLDGNAPAARECARMLRGRLETAELKEEWSFADAENKTPPGFEPEGVRVPREVGVTDLPHRQGQCGVRSCASMRSPTFIGAHASLPWRKGRGWSDLAMSMKTFMAEDSKSACGRAGPRSRTLRPLKFSCKTVRRLISGRCDACVAITPLAAAHAAPRSRPGCRRLRRTRRATWPGARARYRRRRRRGRVRRADRNRRRHRRRR